ncbi:hypothetical protein JMJ77_0006140 [Colletotrichum scovillei]|uniref:Uncharacterized protein n=1 Tax=Colletotrichum scovillei TaxID=1209932 RepID=A0A9P7RJM6_9PEZI|nr:hypothetical protein JMJ77_0006140 [Colletotrichum scovillei]KAG7077373.1 hypothetical protein JMJ76_0014621 [Colletotrichum scovillei]KAG7084483.1 hypothetical protein JMJ78_0009918 [Colletotrichum scovillei]
MQSAFRPGLQKPESCPKNSGRRKIPDTVVHGCLWVIGHCYLTVDLEVPSSRLGSCQFSGGQQRTGRLQIEGSASHLRDCFTDPATRVRSKRIMLPA